MATRTLDNKVHETMMSGKCRCGEPSPCLRVTLAEFYDWLEVEFGYSRAPEARKQWIDEAQRTAPGRGAPKPTTQPL